MDYEAFEFLIVTTTQVGLKDTLDKNDKAQLKRALAEVRLAKKDQQLKKRELVHEGTEVRSEQRTRHAKQGAILGRGKLAHLRHDVRKVQNTANRQAADQQLRGVEARKADVDAVIDALDQLALLVQQLALKA